MVGRRQWDTVVGLGRSGAEVVLCVGCKKGAGAPFVIKGMKYQRYAIPQQGSSIVQRLEILQSEVEICGHG